MYEALWHEVGPSRGSILLRTATPTVALLLLYLEYRDRIRTSRQIQARYSAKEPGAGILKVLLNSFVYFVALFALIALIFYSVTLETRWPRNHNTHTQAIMR